MAEACIRQHKKRCSKDLDLRFQRINDTTACNLDTTVTYTH
jgi:hypothetical protein